MSPNPRARRPRTERGHRAPSPSGGEPRQAASGVGGAGGAGAGDRATHRLALWSLWLLLLAVPFVLDSAQKDAFRLSKALLGETLALLSLLFLAFAWKGPEEWRRLLRAPFVVTFGPFVALATLLSLASPHV